MKFALLLVLLIPLRYVQASPQKEMNVAFQNLMELLPFLEDKEAFLSKANEKPIEKRLDAIGAAFAKAGHEKILKQDLFSPSYDLLKDDLRQVRRAFGTGKKDYARWEMNQITSLCLNCHSFLPPSHPSSFDTRGVLLNPKNFSNDYNLGMAQLLVRRYADAKDSFTRFIDAKFIKKDYEDLLMPFRKLLLIDTKIKKTPSNALKIVEHYLKRTDLPTDLRETLAEWKTGLLRWKDNESFKSDKEVKDFIDQKLVNLRKTNEGADQDDIDLLMASGLLANYLFENPTSPLSADITFWIGWCEKVLARSDLMGAGDLYLKECVRRHPKAPIAKECLKEYRDSVQFGYTGSSGTHVPDEIKKELKALEDLTK